ncbi:hypothetical protein RHSIM_Rhsim03G0191000 [Rhododendron simsii]|uniref:Uncharacterized protein n=1 Tax=Rhododendron simsii TaxID=118357 RepID=A0A834H4E7_RHOSS|nr:hypothetical protein RHSIM_Rhsim03G0191000 [Rhododendron simsii]
MLEINNLIALEISDSVLVLFVYLHAAGVNLQLIDSDSDDPSVSEDANKETNKVESSMKEKKCNDGNPTMSQPKRTKASVCLKQRIYGKISIQRRFLDEIQKLVSSRLSYFFPPGAIHNSANKHSFSSVIDYRSQFSQGKGSKHQAAGTSNAEKLKKWGKSAAEVVSQGSEGPDGKRESGAGFKRSKKKTAAKNTSQKKKPATKRK